MFADSLQPTDAEDDSNNYIGLEVYTPQVLCCV